MKKLIAPIIFGLIIILAGFLRFYKIAENPPSLSWDEVSVGYNAWSVLHWGKDEWGKTLPLVFKSFEDYKNPVHIYLTVPFIAAFGLNEFGVRASSALFGVANVVLIFFLVKKLVGDTFFGKNNVLALLSAFFLAISPYNIHFSRFDHELNFALFFFMLGLLFFYKGLEKGLYIPISFLCFCLTIITYNAPKLFVPIFCISLVLLNFKKLMIFKKQFIFGIVIVMLFAALIFFDKNISGSERFKQTAFSEGDIKNTQLFKKYNSYQLGFLEIVGKQYLLHFQSKFLFISGSTNPRLSSQGTGEFYKFDIPFLIIGVVSLLWFLINKKSKTALIILLWAFLAPLPSAFVNEAPHAARSMFMNGSWHIILAIGVYTTVFIFKNKYLRILISIVLLFVLSNFVYKYLDDYYNNYSNKYAIEWQYGIKQVVKYVKDHPEYDEVYMTAERQQPYIFYLFYLKTPLPTYLKTVSYNKTQSRSANTVAAYSQFHFGLWDPIESQPVPHILYVVTPSDYTGLRHKFLFDTVYTVKYPNRADAFFLVTAKTTFD